MNAVVSRTLSCFDRLEQLGLITLDIRFAVIWWRHWH